MLEKIFYRIEDYLSPSLQLLPYSERTEVILPYEGRSVSVEMALNSRCSSDYDGNPRKFHWGMFDGKKKLLDHQIKDIIGLAKIPRFTNRKIEIQSNYNILSFLIDNQTTGITRNLLMVESGMQQQAVGLVCAALGVGMVLKNLGKDGIVVSDTWYATIRAHLDAMKPSYNGNYWSKFPPSGRNSWLKGNLPEPNRNGNKPLIATLANLDIKNRGSNTLTTESLSQLLWAGRGRTPHLYKSKPWGMTIPTWTGDKDITAIYLISGKKLSRYINWQNNRPAHSLLEIREIDNEFLYRLEKYFVLNEKMIVINKNDNFSRALWEAGYQIVNILVQAKALDISYQTSLLDRDQKYVFRNIGIPEPVAAIAF